MIRVSAVVSPLIVNGLERHDLCTVQFTKIQNFIVTVAARYVT